MNLTDKFLSCIISNKILKSPTKWNSHRSLSLDLNPLTFICLTFSYMGFCFNFIVLEKKKKFLVSITSFSFKIR